MPDMFCKTPLIVPLIYIYIYTESVPESSIYVARNSKIGRKNQQKWDCLSDSIANSRSC